MGRNLYGASRTLARTARSLNAGDRPCVFISHRKDDALLAREVADYLTDVIDVDVYLDLDDEGLAGAAAVHDHGAIVESIEKGLDVSTHLLGVISERTAGSWWVPFEIGYARHKRCGVAYVLGESVTELPSYLKIADLLTDRIELARWAESLRTDTTQRSARSSFPAVNGLPTIRFRSAVRFVDRD